MLGTFVEVTAGGAPRSRLDTAIDGAFRAVAEVHRLMSFHEPESDVSRLNRDASTRAVRVHPWTYEVLRMAHELHEASAGRFDIAIPSGLPPGRRRPRREAEDRSIPGDTRAIKTAELLPGRRVRFLHSGVRIDLGGIAKGFAVDRAIDVLYGRGISRGLVNAGGDLAAFGPDASAVYVRDPRTPLRVLCRIEVRNEALASSGRPFDLFQSSRAMPATVIDPSTGQAPPAVSGATVRAPSCMLADALTKVVMVEGAAAAPLLARYRASAMFVSAEGDLWVTRGWEAAVRLDAGIMESGGQHHDRSPR